MKVKGSRRLVARLGLALAVAAIAAPSAQAVRMNAMYESGGGARLYADDLHQPLPLAMLKASNVRTDAASLDSPNPGSNVQSDAASSFEPKTVPISFAPSSVRTDSASFDSPNPGSNVQSDAASSRPGPVPVLFIASSVQTDAASSVSSPITDARHSALLRHMAQLDQQPAQLASSPLASTDSPGIDWSVAAIGAILGALGLMLLVAVVLFTGRHNRRGRLAAT